MIETLVILISSPSVSVAQLIDAQLPPNIVVQKGDSLSGILFQLGYEPLWGKNGNIAKTLTLNRHLRKSRGNFILPGTVVWLPGSIPSPAINYYQTKYIYNKAPSIIAAGETQWAKRPQHLLSPTSEVSAKAPTTERAPAQIAQPDETKEQVQDKQKEVLPPKPITSEPPAAETVVTEPAEPKIETAAKLPPGQEVPDQPAPRAAPTLLPAQLPKFPQPISLPELEDISIPGHPAVWVWAGSGLGYTQYSQEVGSFSSVQFQNFDGPSYFFRTGGTWTDSFGMDFSFKETPGQVKSSTGIEVDHGRYKWRSMSGEGLFCIQGCESWQRKTLNLRLGFQIHSMPFLVPTDPGKIDVRSEGVTMASGGIDFKVLRRRRIHFEGLFRYQYPLTATSQGGGQLDLKPKLIFDGSAGEVYNISEHLRVGFYWYGQYHSYEFRYNDPTLSSSDTTYSGSQSLFFSTFEIRLGYEY